MNKEIKDVLLKVILFGMGVFIFFWVYQDPERDNSGNIISEGSLKTGDLLAGDCYLEDVEDFIEEVPCSFGSMVAFKVTDNCWHGFAPYEGKRLSIQLNYIHPESFKIHSIRHRLSAFLKKFKVWF